MPDRITPADISPDREYVIVNNIHPPMWAGCLLFWGSLTEDGSERRSFGGYTTDFSACERYRLDEIRAEPGYRDFPLYDPGTMSLRDFMECRDIITRVSDIPSLGVRKIEAWYR